MQVKALYDHGKIEFPTDVKFKHERFHVVVDVPDDEIINDSLEVKKDNLDIRSRINLILGKYAESFHGGEPIDAKKEWHEHLERKYLK